MKINQSLEEKVIMAKEYLTLLMEQKIFLNSVHEKLHMFYSLPINNVKIQLSNKQIIEQNSKKIVEEFYSSIKTIFLRIHPKESKINPCDNSIHITCIQNIFSRLNDNKIGWGEN